MKREYVIQHPKCIWDHKRCFANNKGNCKCLKDNIFNRTDCPFYNLKS